MFSRHFFSVSQSFPHPERLAPFPTAPAAPGAWAPPCRRGRAWFLRARIHCRMYPFPPCAARAAPPPRRAHPLHTGDTKHNCSSTLSSWGGEAPCSGALSSPRTSSHPPPPPLPFLRPAPRAPPHPPPPLRDSYAHGSAGRTQSVGGRVRAVRAVACTARRRAHLRCRHPTPPYSHPHPRSAGTTRATDHACTPHATRGRCREEAPFRGVARDRVPAERARARCASPQCNAHTPPPLAFFDSRRLPFFALPSPPLSPSPCSFFHFSLR